MPLFNEERLKALSVEAMKALPERNQVDGSLPAIMKCIKSRIQRNCKDLLNEFIFYTVVSKNRVKQLKLEEKAVVSDEERDFLSINYEE